MKGILNKMLNFVNQLELFTQLNGNLITLFLGNEIVVKLNRSSISSDLVEKPIKAYVNSAGYDLVADESVSVFPNSRTIISAGLRMSIPKGY